MSDTPPNPENQNVGNVPAARSSAARKLGLGAALVVLPLGTAFVGWKLHEMSEKSDRELEKGLAYDVEKARQVDPKLINYHRVGRIDTGFAAPDRNAPRQVMAMDAKGNLLVSGPGAIRVFDPSGRRLADIALEGQATAVASDAEHVYVAMRDHIAVYGIDGSLKTTWATLGDRALVSSIAVSGDHVWLADSGRRVVVRCGADGKVLGELAREDSSRGIPGLVAPSPHVDVAVDAHGRVWVSNPGRHQFEIYSPEGELQRVWGKAGSAVEEFFGCCNPSDFALLADGRVVTAEKGLARVKVFSAEGKLQSVVAAPEAFSENQDGLDLASSADGKVYVLEPAAKAVWIYEPNGGGA